MRTIKETSGKTSHILTFTLQGSQKEKTEKGTENIFEDKTAANFPNL